MCETASYMIGRSQRLKGVQEANLHMEPLFMQMFNVQNLISFILPSSISVTLVWFNLLCFASLLVSVNDLYIGRQAGRQAGYLYLVS